MSKARSPFLHPDVVNLLAALDGVIYVVAADGTILTTNERRWNAAAVTGGAPALTSAFVEGRSLFAMIAGEELQGIAQRMHEAAISSDGDSVISYTFRCDGPSVERHMRMSMAALSLGRVRAVIYQSILLSESVRAPISLFEPATIEAYFDEERTKTIVTLCSYCHLVAWPLDADPKDRDWIEPTDYYRRGGPSEMRVSHGICPACYRSVVVRNLGPAEQD